MKRGIIWVLSFLLVLVMIPGTIAQSPSQHGMDIANAFKMSNKGFQTMEADLTIINEDVHGHKIHKLVGLRASELSSDGNQSIIFLEKSGADKGNTTWVVTRKNASNKQWRHNLHDPSPKIIRKSHATFMNTEFTFEDFAVSEVARYVHKLLREEMDDDDHIYVVERKPLDRNSKYYRQVVWYNASKGYRIKKIVFYDLNDELLKTLKMKDFSKHEGKYWRPTSMHMHNHQTKRKTIILFDNYEFGHEGESIEMPQASLARMGQNY